jgi:four helix bundle protein
MALHELTIYQKHYDLMLYAIPLINKYPKSQRYVVGQQTMNLMLDIARSIIQANREKGKYRLRTLCRIDGQLEELRLLVRLAKDLNMLPVKQYGLISERTSETGRLLGGWIKQTRKALESS